MERHQAHTVIAQAVRQLQQMTLEAAHFGHHPTHSQAGEFLEDLLARTHGNCEDDEVGFGGPLFERHLRKLAIARRRIVDDDAVTLAAEESTDPAAHAALAADHQRAERVALVDGIEVGRLFFDRLADQKGGEIAPQNFVETEQGAGIGKTLVDLGLNLEIPERDARSPFEFADLTRQLEAFADQVEDPSIQGLDIAAVLVEQLSGRSR